MAHGLANFIFKELWTIAKLVVHVRRACKLLKTCTRKENKPTFRIKNLDHIVFALCAWKASSTYVSSLWFFTTKRKECSWRTSTHYCFTTQNIICENNRMHTSCGCSSTCVLLYPAEIDKHDLSKQQLPSIKINSWERFPQFPGAQVF